MTRRRRDRLAGALRHFGLVDQFQLAALLAGEALPSERDIAIRVRAQKELLPAGITPEYLARFVRDELRSVDSRANSPSTLSQSDIARLEAIAPGREGAPKYHNLIFKSLNAIFAGRLVDPVKEAEQFQGRKRIDIRYRNADKTGFFAELAMHEIKAPYVIVECKNYKDDPENPEFDQLSGRLNSRVGMFGIMVVRTIQDPSRTEAHCLDRRAKHEWIIVLDDRAIVRMLTAHLDGDAGRVDRVLRERFEPLLFD